MAERLALLGFGEAGASIAAGLAAGGAGVTAFDLAFRSPGGAARMDAARAIGIVPHEEVAPAVADATIVVSAVPGAVAVDVARAAAPHLRAPQIYLDLNSVSPATKRAVAAAVAESGAACIEAAVMARVLPYGHRVPMLLAGPGADAVATRLNALGMATEAVGEAIGEASANKMVRSIVIKGIEALLMEALVAADRAGITERILDSVAATFPGIDWRATASYYLDRSLSHGARRITEMQEVADTLRELGLEPVMAEAIGRRIGWAYETADGEPWPPADGGGYQAVLDTLARAAARSSQTRK
jgi:3-hydroxyisobutyrate dehydrogenase-like beta-hydroxyacid dehydrogenase